MESFIYQWHILTFVFSFNIIWFKLLNSSLPCPPPRFQEKSTPACHHNVSQPPCASTCTSTSSLHLISCVFFCSSFSVVRQQMFYITQKKCILLSPYNKKMTQIGEQSVFNFRIERISQAEVKAWSLVWFRFSVNEISISWLKSFSKASNVVFVAFFCARIIEH